MFWPPGEVTLQKEQGWEMLNIEESADAITSTRTLTSLPFYLQYKVYSHT